MAPRTAFPVTDWFPAKVLPVRTGLYQVRTWRSGGLDEVEWCWFDVELGKWGWAYADKRAACSKVWRNPQGAIQEKAWRGVAGAPAV